MRDLAEITRVGEPPVDNTEWPKKLAAPMPASSIRWRQDGKSTQRDAKWTCRVVAYVDADAVRERLDDVVPGEWDLTLEALPDFTEADKDGVVTGRLFAVKARLQIYGVIRENFGQGKDWKSAATDAFKRAAARFGIGHELGTPPYKAVWVEVLDGSKYAKLVGDPNKVVEGLKARWQAKLERERSGGSSGANGGGASEPARQNGASAGRSSAPAAPPARSAASAAVARPDTRTSDPSMGGAGRTPSTSSPRQEYYDHKREPGF